MEKIKKHLSILITSLFLLLLLSNTSIGMEKNIEMPQKDPSNLLLYEYYNYDNMTKDLQIYAQENPDIMKLEALGETYQGRTIWGVIISDNADINENEAGVLLMGAHHGNEKPSFEVCMYFIKFLCDNYGLSDTDNDNDGDINEDPVDGIDNDNDGLIDEDPDEKRITDVVDTTQIFIIPMVNPDGVEANTRINCAEPAGVDLNRNYPYKWEYYDYFPALYGDRWTGSPGTWNYRGENPFSEKETQAVRDFVIDQDIKISLSYHSYGEFIIYPWMHSSAKTPHEEFFISIGEGIVAINDYDLETGRNYFIPRLGGTIGTSENWLYSEKGILSYTVELCRTRAPSNPRVMEELCLTHAGVNLYVCERAQTIVKKNPTNTYNNLFEKMFSFLKI